jgi:hypothetical protein
MPEFRASVGHVVAAVPALAILLSLLFIIDTARYLYVGTNAAGIAFELTAACSQRTSDAGCTVGVQELGYGRKRLSIQGAELEHAVLTLRSDASAGVLIVRSSRAPNGATANLRLVLVPETMASAPPPVVLHDASRLIIALAPKSQDQYLRIRLDPPAGSSAIVLDEIGLFRSASDVTPHWLLSGDTKIARVRMAGALVVLFGAALLAAFLPTHRWAAGTVSTAVGLAAVLAFLIVLADTQGPDWANDLRASLAAGALLEPAGTNSNSAVHMAQGILHGAGPLVAGAPPWHRMPGYAYLVALVGVRGDLLATAVNSVFLAVIATGVALGLLVRALVSLAPLWAAAVIGIVLVLLPKHALYTQIEAFVQVPVFLVLAAGCLFAAQAEQRGRASLLAHVLLHAAFAFWFAIRVDVLPGWALVSLLLYGSHPRRWPFLLIPACFALAIAVPWALFKQPFTHEFSLTTNSFGAALMVGQWEVPHPFVWSVSDEAYDRWAQTLGLDPFSKAASDVAVREVLRFWLTFPGYLVALIWHAFTDFWTDEIASGQRVFSSLSFKHTYPLVALSAVFVALAAWHRPLRVLLLGWIVFFNVPLFFVIYSGSGRFYAPGLISLTLLFLLLVFDRELYLRILRRPLRCGLAAALGLAIFLFGERLDDLLISSDAFRFATPFTSPKNSSLAIYAADSERVLVRSEDTGGHLDLAKMATSESVAAIPAGTSHQLSRSGAGPLAAIPLPKSVTAFRHCRIGLAFDLHRGEITVDVRAPGGEQLLATPPRLASGIGADALDFNIPVDDALAGSSSTLTLALHATAPGDTAMTLHSATLYRCGS